MTNRKQCKQPEMTVSNQQYDLMYYRRGASLYHWGAHLYRRGTHFYRRGASFYRRGASIEQYRLVSSDLMYCPFEMLSAFLLAIGMLCIYLTLNLELPGLPSGRYSYPSGCNSYPSGRKMLQHAGDFVRSEQLYQSLPQDKCGPILLASVQLSIKLILSLSLVS